MFGKRRSSRKDPEPPASQAGGQTKSQVGRGGPPHRDSERDAQRAAEALAEGAIPLKMPPMKPFRRDAPAGGGGRAGGEVASKGPATVSAGPGSLAARASAAAQPHTPQPHTPQPHTPQPHTPQPRTSQPQVAQPRSPQPAVTRPTRPPLTAPVRTPAERLRDELTAAQPGRCLIVGADIRLMGEIRDCDRLVVEGIVEGDIAETRVLEIAESGRVEGRAAVESCDIAGEFTGELEVRALLSLRGTARARGRLRYGEIETERGAELGGDVDRYDPRELPAKDRA